ncbi:hypothetical protein Q6272_29630, partial [Klebsiella pneumoniae]|uniref:hypothetical protein n=1 Tax=Klebsiella pneumoniae TaxID=573 RepID=UPI00273148DA
PHYAVPLFLRIKVKMETTGTFKYQKVRLKEEAFDPEKATRGCAAPHHVNSVFGSVQLRHDQFGRCGAARILFMPHALRQFNHRQLHFFVG